MAKEKRKPLTAIQLIEILRDRVKEYGDLPVTVNTQDGGTYSLYDGCDVSLVTWTNPKTKETHQTIDIG